jgi:ParB family chromosome partitioning protein
MTGVESNRTESIPVDQIVVIGERRRIDDAKVSKFMESIYFVGLLSPPVVVPRKEQDGKGKYKLIAGAHRLEAVKQLNMRDIRCTVLGRGDDLRIELAEIDENFIRDDPSPVEHALLTGRRREIIIELDSQDSTLSQGETASPQAKRRGGQQTGPDVGSVRDHASKTGESKDKVHRSMKRYDKLGPVILKSIVGTSLDTGVELNALMKLPPAERDDLARRAAGGEPVTARRARRKATGEEEEEPQLQSAASRPRQASEELSEWISKYCDLIEEYGLLEQAEEFWRVFDNAPLIPPLKRTLQNSQMSVRRKKWPNLNPFTWRKGRKGD